ncbi:MAG: helical backbone metal receptor [Gemmatimonadetes bacterium]|nr:helical backbone metal receptor [Gemmatimonadota bacterium]
MTFGHGSDRLLARASRSAAWGGAVLALAACGGGTETPGRQVDAGAERTPAVVEVVDDAGRAVRLERPARRVVSLVPSVTETVVALGAADRLVARTRYDDAPELAGLPSVGGGLDPSIESIVALEPDLVVAWNAREGRLASPLVGAGIPVYLADIQDTTGIFTTIRRFGALLGRGDAADSLAGALRDSLAAVAAGAGEGARPAVFYWMAGDPPRTAGRSTFIGEAIDIAGGTNAFGDLRARWPAVSLEAVVARDPDVVVVPVGDGLPDAEDLAATPGWRELTAVRTGRLVEIPADLFARPGPRLGAAARALREGLEAVHPAEAR